MSPIPYTGNLMRIAQKPGALKLPPPSGRHGVNEGAQTLNRQQSTVAAGTGSEFQGSDFDEVMTTGHGMLLDTPTDSPSTPPGSGGDEGAFHITYPEGNPHSSTAILSLRGANAAAGGSGAPVGFRVEGDTSLNGKQHNGFFDRGWIRSIFGPSPLYRDQTPHATITPSGPTASVEGPAGDGGAKYGRGINALGINNPGGFRHGRYQLNTNSNNNFTHITRDIGTQYIQAPSIYTPGPQQRMVGSMITPPSLPQGPPNPNDIQYAASDYSSSSASTFGGF